MFHLFRWASVLRSAAFPLLHSHSQLWRRIISHLLFRRFSEIKRGIFRKRKEMRQAGLHRIVRLGVFSWRDNKVHFWQHFLKKMRSLWFTIIKKELLYKWSSASACGSRKEVEIAVWREKRECSGIQNWGQALIKLIQIV